MKQSEATIECNLSIRSPKAFDYDQSSSFVINNSNSKSSEGKNFGTNWFDLSKNTTAIESQATPEQDHPNNCKQRNVSILNGSSSGHPPQYQLLEAVSEVSDERSEDDSLHNSKKVKKLDLNKISYPREL